MHPVIRIGLFVFLTITALGAAGQSVGVVLSGGGSKGLSHIGVLKALEEDSIPVDYIAGTSMGAIIGGLYASGYSPEEIEKIALSGSFEKWASSDIDPEYIYYFKKYPENASWANINFRYSKELNRFRSSLPASLITPHQLEYVFLEYFSVASRKAGYNFDSLMIPFRCVASDVETGSVVSFRNGQLGSAIRASMTFPFYLRPIRVEGKLLFDGGIYDNFPVDLCLNDFSPDIVIGSKAVSNYGPLVADDIISQVQGMIVNKTDFSLPDSIGILIEPDLPQRASIFDFSNKVVYMENGYAATKEQMPLIKSRIERRMSPEEAGDRRRRFRPENAGLIIDSVKITGLKKNQERYVSKMIKQRSKYVTLDNFKEKYFKLIADNKIKYIYPELSYDDKSGFYFLEMEIERDDPFQVSFGGNIASRPVSTAFLGLQYRYFGRFSMDFTANGYFGQFYSSAMTMARLDLPSSFPFYFSLNYTFNRKDYFKSNEYFFEDEEPSYLVQSDNHGTVQVGMPGTNAGKFTLSYSNGFTRDLYYQDNYFTRGDTADATYFYFDVGEVLFEINSLNMKQFPSKGTHLLLQLSFISGKENTFPGSTSSETPGTVFRDYHKWLHFHLIYDNYFSQIKFFTFGFRGEFFLSNQPFFQNYTATLLRTPSFEPIPEMKVIFLSNYRATNYAAVGFKTIFKLYKQFNLRMEGHLFQPYEELSKGENGEAMKRKLFSYRSYIASANLVYHSPIGPISLSFNYYDRAEDKFSIFFNIGYIIFNSGVLD